MNRLLPLIAFVFSLMCLGVQGQNNAPVRVMTLGEVLDLAENQSSASKQAETRRKNRYWEYRLHRSNYNPQMVLSGNIPGYNRDYLSNRLDDGTILYQGREQLNSGLNLGLQQPIPWTGGNVSINSNLHYFSDLNRDLTRYNSTLFNIELQQPLFGFNQLKWDKRTEPLRYEESRRSYVEEMEFISRQAVNYFFDYLDAQINFRIANFNLQNNDTIYKIEMGRFNIGTTSEDKLLQVELQLLRSQQDVTQARLDLRNAGQTIRAYLGIDVDSLDLVLPDDIPEFSIPIEEALTYAKMNRADYLAFERRRIEADRQIANARAQRFQANIVASYGLNTASEDFSEAYSQSNDQQRIDVGLVVPILDWGRNRARMETALANKELTDYVIEQDIRNFEQEIMNLVRQFEVLRQQVDIARQSNLVAQKRYEVAQNRYLTGKVDITNLNIALTEKDNAQRSYIRSLRDFWTAYFDLRRLTLYDFDHNELLYQPD
ncbi:MAG TPA: TolC family protein [Cryomorphaceae bacterium]|nr:TolC family protein [Cryomorphaceae bacterium]